jgi:hypothetical protein
VTEQLSKLAYSIAELCQMAGVGRSFLYEEVKAGHLVLTKAGRRSIVLHDDAVAWLTHLPKRAPASTPPGGRRSVS